MADDDDYVEGDANSAPADAQGAVPADDAPASDVIDSASVQEGTPVQRMGRNTARSASARKAFAEAILASKEKPPVVHEDQEDPEDVALAATEAPKTEAPKPAAAAPAAAATPPAPEPPAPSLHPEVLKLKQQLAAELEAAKAERAAAKPAAPAAPSTATLEDYIDSPPRAYRLWLEEMRGEKFASDEEFKAEASDFVTQMSADVLGVALPENVRTKLDAAMARKAVRTHKTIQARRDAEAAQRAEKERAAAAEKAEAERVEQEWTRAAGALTQHFAPKADAAGALAPSEAAKAYPWLAAEDDPGKIVVDVIRAAANKDGTQLAWADAAKRANDYLEAQAKTYYGKRQALLAPTPTPTPTQAAKPAPRVAAPATPPAPAPPAPAKPQKWSRDRHLDNTKAAFRAAMAGKTQ